MKFALSLLAGASFASAHTIFVQLAANGVTNPVSYGIRTPTYDGPINDVTSNDLACNGGPNPTTPSSKIIAVKAGSTVQATWRHTLTSDATDVIDPSHKGPVIAYMKKVGDATTDVGYGPGWFKISEAGFNAATGKWAVDDLIANGGIQQIPIPSCIADGQYLLRAELIALHAAGSPGGAQFYMECAQISVTGGTSVSTPATVSLPGAYSATDPGIYISIFFPVVTSYKIPGPPVFTCGASTPTTLVTKTSTTTTKPATTTTTKPPTTTTKAATTTTAAATPSAPGTGGAAPWAQCGGTNWIGPITCVSGTCSYINPFFSQCLP